MDAETVTEADRRIPHLLSEAQSAGARDELRGSFKRSWTSWEWRQSPDDPKQGQAFISLYPLPTC